MTVLHLSSKHSPDAIILFYTKLVVINAEDFSVCVGKHQQITYQQIQP